MRLLSLDCSTTIASACLIEGETAAASSQWFEERARHEGLFEVVEKLIADSGWSWADVDMFTVGRGPGAYSGLRVSLLAARALAAPGGKTVYSVSSVEALAARLMKDNGLDEITIIGDARRDSFWYGTCRADTIESTAVDWKVTPRTEYREVLRNSKLLATPHWDALQVLRDQVTDINWLAGGQIPSAEDVGRLATRRMENSVNPEALTPLYLHPAV